jgi:hypothetical protein
VEHGFDDIHFEFSLDFNHHKISIDKVFEYQGFSSSDEIESIQVDREKKCGDMRDQREEIMPELNRFMRSRKNSQRATLGIPGASVNKTKREFNRLGD